MRVTIGILGTALAAGVIAVVLGLRWQRAASERENAATWRSAATATADALAAATAGDAERLLAHVVAGSDAVVRGSLWRRNSGGEVEVAVDTATTTIPPAVHAAIAAVLDDGVARAVDTPDGPVHCVAVAHRGEPAHAAVALWTRNRDTGSAAVLLSLGAALLIGLAFGPGRSLVRIERAVRGALPARSLAEIADRVESQLAPGRVDSRIARHVKVRTSELESQCRRQEELLSNTAHELRTPLTIVMASLGMLRDGLCDDDAEVEAEVEHAHAAGQHLMFLINDLVDSAAADAGRLRLDLDEIPVGGLLAEIRGLLSPIAAVRGIRLHTSPDDPDLSIHGDRPRVMQVLFNLAGNSFKYSSDGSEVEVRTIATETAVRFEILDRGIGVPAAQRGGLFRRFSRVHDPKSTSAGGNGLGLHLSKVLVEEMGGRVGYRERSDGPGSAFWFELPRTGAAAPVQSGTS